MVARNSGSPRRVLVLGGGFVGANVVGALRARQVEVSLLTRQPLEPFAARLVDDTPTIIADAGDVTTLAAAAEDHDELVWAIGSLKPGEADLDPASDVSLMLRTLLPCLAVMTRRPELGLTFVSSGGTVYGRPAIFPTPEDAPTDPISAYGITRLMAEKYILRHRELHGNPTRIARVANVYGTGQTAERGQGFIAAALHCAAVGSALTLFGDGAVSRDFIHVADAADYLATIATTRPDPIVVNVGSGESTRLTDVIDAIRGITGRPLPVVRHPARGFDVPRVELAVDTLRSIARFSPRPLADGIARTWAEQFAPPDSATIDRDLAAG